MSETDIYKKQNFGNRIGFGRRAALLIVDFTVGFNDPAHFGGGNIDAAVKRTVGLLAHFREQAAGGLHPHRLRRRRLRRRRVRDEDARHAELTEKHPAGQIVPELTPLAGRVMVRKTQASGFFGTGLAAWLVQQGCDTVVVTGCTTSGCVRATVVDACRTTSAPSSRATAWATAPSARTMRTSSTWARSTPTSWTATRSLAEMKRLPRAA